jgi:hypothetical protein
MPKCVECIHVGVITPKGGAKFLSWDGVTTIHIAHPNIPYCSKLNIALGDADDYITCSSHKDQPKPESTTTKP